VTIRHYYTRAQRSELRNHRRHARNELWSVFMRCPAPQLFAVAAFRAARQFGYAEKRGWRWILREPVWWWDALRGLPSCLKQREPLRWSCYRNWMALVRNPIFSETEWAKKFRRIQKTER